MHILGLSTESEDNKSMRLGMHQLLAVLLRLGHHRDHSELLPNTIQLLSGAHAQWPGEAASPGSHSTAATEGCVPSLPLQAWDFSVI